VTTPANEDAAAELASRPRLVRVVGGLTAVNAATTAVAFVTAPLQARALGAGGRGDLAAIIVPLSLSSQVLGLALGAYAARELARKRPVGVIAGSLGAVLAVVGIAGAGVGIAAAGELADGRHTVHVFLVVGFALLPLSLLVNLLYSMLAGLERWRLLVLTRLLPVVATFVAIVVLYVGDSLTVASAAVTTIASSLLALFPLLGLLRGGGRISFSREIARAGTIFGLKTWVGGVASLANNRVDQLIMVRAVAPRELGLYAVAVTISGLPSLVTGALGPPLLTRVAKGEHGLVPRALRLTLSAILIADVVAAAVTPFVLPLLFGEEFADAVGMSLVLFAASIPLAGVTVLASSLVSLGRPGTPSVGEALALVVTVIGLVLLLDPLGGLGAAIASVAAYSVNFAFQLVMTRRRLGGSFADYLVPTRADVAWARALLPGGRG
jgi:O-antigen/teichoic acid export membrane protein